jgi:hypothetical protein
MDWLKQLAPTIFSCLASPLAGLAVSAVSKAMGVPEDDAKSMLESAKLSSEQIAQVKLAEIELQKQAQSLGLDFEKLAVDDRKSARDMQAATHSVWPGVLSAITTTAIIAIIGARMRGMTLPDDSTTVQLIGSLTTGWGMCLAYWFGTTRGSQTKDQLLYSQGKSTSP